MHHSEKWKARNSRIARFSGSVSVRAGDRIAEHIKRSVEGDPDFARETQELQERAVNILLAQKINGADLYVDQYLRQFVTEANNRILMGEGSKLPTSFNVMRAFVEPDEQTLILRLLPENLYSVGLGRLLDYVTDPKKDFKLSQLASELEEFVIYEINMFGGFSEIKIPDIDTYTFYGVAFVREHNELSIMGVVGRDNPQPVEARVAASAQTMFPGKEFLVADRESIDLSDEALFGNHNVQPIIVLTRIDLDDMTVQVRYVLEEKRESFMVFTDDPMILDEMKLFERPDDAIRNTLSNLSRHSNLINFVNSIPLFYPALEELSDDFVSEKRPTKFKLEASSTDIRKLKANLKNFDTSNYVHVNTLAGTGEHQSVYSVPGNDLKVEVDGYWKTLPLGASGADKTGRLVQGKSWVTEHNSWIERTEIKSSPVGAGVDVQITLPEGESVGYIYVLRSSMHPKNVYKIGFTVRTPDERAAQLSATSGQPDMFNVVQSWRVRNPRAIEQHVHGLLREYRINLGREFFSLKYKNIRECIERVIDQADAFIDE